MNIYTLQQIDMAIKAVEHKMYNINIGITNNSLQGTIEQAKKQAQVSEIILDALKYYKENGIGDNIDERI